MDCITSHEVVAYPELGMEEGRQGERFRRTADGLSPGRAGLDRVIDHLKLTFAAERTSLPECAGQDFFMVADPPAEYFP